MRRRACRGAGGALFNPNNYQHVGRRLAEQLKKTEKTASSSPTSGTISTTARPTMSRPGRRSGKSAAATSTGFICAIGTGGTIAGASTFLREKKKEL